jgi:ubiquinone biosynthesis protein
MRNKHGSLVGAARRDLGRLRKVSATIVRHGFGELLLKTPLGRRLMGKADLVEASDAVEGTPAVRFTHMLASLGPTFIKLGQVLSMRQDLFSREWIEALSTLQDGAPDLPFASVREIIEEALGIPLEEAFTSFDEVPIATASIAQVHGAVTREGEQVVVKVQRPSIEEIMRGDLSLLYLGAQVLEASIDELRLIGITDIVGEFERALLRELDFREELGNLLRMRSLLDPARTVTVPLPYPDLSDKTVLTMERFEGKAIRKLGPADPRACHAVEELVRAFCKQVLVDGFFHGDPHAGNILCAEDGTLCLIDLGLVGALTVEQRADIVTLLVATVANDSAGIARILLKMGTPTQRVSLLELRSEIERIRAKYLANKAVNDVDSAGFAQEFSGAAQKFRIKLATEYAVLVKSVATIEGIVRRLHPGVDVVAIARPYLQQTLAKRFAPQEMLRDLTSEVGTLGSLVHRLPNQVDQLLHDFETGNLQIRAVTPTLNELPNVVQQSAGRLTLALFASVMTVCAALVLPADVHHHTARLILTIALALAAALSWVICVLWHFVPGRPLRLTPLLKLLRRGK